jgi:hypothetical protein
MLDRMKVVTITGKANSQSAARQDLGGHGVSFRSE